MNDWDRTSTSVAQTHVKTYLFPLPERARRRTVRTVHATRDPLLDWSALVTLLVAANRKAPFVACFADRSAVPTQKNEERIGQHSILPLVLEVADYSIHLDRSLR